MVTKQAPHQASKTEYNRETQIELTEDWIRLLEKLSSEYHERLIKADYMGHLVAIDTFLVDTLKGTGRFIFRR